VSTLPQLLIGYWPQEEDNLDACSQASRYSSQRPDYGDRVNLIKKKIKIDNAWRFAPVVPEANGRLKDRVRINGEIETHPEGAY
jgi:hypothetical protein